MAQLTGSLPGPPELKSVCRDPSWNHRSRLLNVPIRVDRESGISGAAFEIVIGVW